MARSWFRAISLEVRATDGEGRSQPEVRDPDRKDPYELNTPHRVNVTCVSPYANGQVK